MLAWGDAVASHGLPKRDRERFSGVAELTSIAEGKREKGKIFFFGVYKSRKLCYYFIEPRHWSH